MITDTERERKMLDRQSLLTNKRRAVYNTSPVPLKQLKIGS